MVEDSNLELCFGTNVGTNQAKIEKILIVAQFWQGQQQLYPDDK